MFWWICVIILVLVGFCVTFCIIGMYEGCTDWIKEVTKTEKEMALKRIREENEKH